MVHMHVARSGVGYCGLAVKVGSRDEDALHHGLAHFVEHTIFKGTTRRSSWHIINRMEAVGGEINAFTTKEETVVFSAFPSGNPTRAAELISDLVCNSRFPSRELDKEREVVADEIDSYLDVPADAVFDDFEDLLFAGSPIGHNILGNKASLATFDTECCRSYLGRWYVAPNMVAFYAGSMNADRVFKIFDHLFAPCAGPQPLRNIAVPPTVGSFEVHRPTDSHQCHTVMGIRTPGMASEMRYPLALFTNIVGGPGMNSLLNVSLREKNGLVYSVEAATGLFSDCGEFTVYYGCDPDDESRCRSLVASVMERISDGYISERRLQAAKKQYLGQLKIANENLENRILGVARRTLFCGSALSQAEVREEILGVSASAIREIGEACRNMSSLTFGPA